MSKTGNCPVVGCGDDFVTRFLDKIGATRSALVSLALVPFAFEGILWFRDAIAWAWDTITAWGN